MHSICDPSKVRFTGPLAPFASGLAAELNAMGYATTSAANQLRLAAHLSQWLEAQHLEPGDLTGPVVDRFEVARRRTYTNPFTRLRCWGGRRVNWQRILWSREVILGNMITIGARAIYAYHALGQYALAFRSASLPSALIGVALSQVYLREAARRVDSPVLALRAFYQTLARLAGVSVVPMVVI